MLIKEVCVMESIKISNDGIVIKARSIKLNSSLKKPKSDEITLVANSIKLR